MNKVLVFAAVVAFTVLVSASAVSAARHPVVDRTASAESKADPAAPSASKPVQVAQALWTCRAESPVAYGVGISPFYDVAQQRALNECAVRTPTYYTCYIKYCQ